MLIADSWVCQVICLKCLEINTKYQEGNLSLENGMWSRREFAKTEERKPYCEIRTAFFWRTRQECYTSCSSSFYLSGIQVHTLIRTCLNLAFCSKGMMHGENRQLLRVSICIRVIGRLALWNMLLSVCHLEQKHLQSLVLFFFLSLSQLKLKSWTLQEVRNERNRRLWPRILFAKALNRWIKLIMSH